jgi:hypothetical protein
VQNVKDMAVVSLEKLFRLITIHMLCEMKEERRESVVVKNMNEEAKNE